MTILSTSVYIFVYIRSNGIVSTIGSWMLYFLYPNLVVKPYIERKNYKNIKINKKKLRKTSFLRPRPPKNNTQRQ
jgi:hypothetical protein